jgi:glutaredoxin-related protein
LKLPGDWDSLVPLLRGNVVGYDALRMTLEFTMLTPDAKKFDCSISNAELDFLDKRKITSPGERKGQFLRLRDTIESVASNLFDASEPGQELSRRSDSRQAGPPPQREHQTRAGWV